MLIPLIWFTSLSFLGYGTSCLFTRHMSLEFQRYGLARFRMLVGLTQVAAAGGLLLGIRVPAIGMIASGGLALQMLLGVGVRLRIRDKFLQTLPAALYLVLNILLFLGFLSH